MHLQPKRPRRCVLCAPGSSEKMMAKASATEVDQILLDLEDAVAPNAKAAARGQVVTALNTLDWQAKVLCVRINDVQTQWCHDDVIEVVTGAGARIDTLMLTKTKCAGDVKFLHLLLDQLELKLGLTKRIGIECLIEDVEGLMNVEEIAASSDRLEAMTFGMGDYSASQQMHLESVGSSGDYPPDIWHYPRYKMTIACRAFGLDPIDGPYADFKDLATLANESKYALTLGMTGKWAIHPSQVAIAQDTFSPDSATLATARKQKAAYEQALKDGLGAISVDGVMVDAASIRMLQNTLDRADLMGL
ncbi:CoA ester lyase [Pseudomonadales bacterium]|jgi:citrate lyase subunit beta/citryl-CoA lyase|nr:CoA ester lyase [Pseudomonadales bacterium]MDB2645692.1 CoA ester lyase [Pseudomonadales bacterium]